MATSQVSHVMLRSPQTGEWLRQPQAAQRFDAFTTVDWMDDELEGHRQQLAQNTPSSLPRQVALYLGTWLVLVLMGVAIGVIAAVVDVITLWLAWLRVGFCRLNFYLNKTFCCWGQELCAWAAWTGFGPTDYVAYVAVSALFGFVAATLVRVYAPLAAGSGISEIKCIVSGFAVRGFLGWWTLAIKALMLPLAIASGLSLGKEGPSVHYAVCVGHCGARLFERFRFSASRTREMLTATSAAGVAVAFGSPMGGVLFAMEEVAATFQMLTLWKLYLCALIAVGTLTALNPFRTGQLVVFEVLYDTPWHYFELPAYAVLGVFGGLYGIAVSRYNKAVAAFRKRYLAPHAVREVVVLATATAMVCYFNQFLRLDMTEVMQALFAECVPKTHHPLCDTTASARLLVCLLLLATALRTALTIVTYGCKVPAGIFVPSMAAGATFGRALGIVVEKIHAAYPDALLFATCPKDGKCIIPGTYAFLGAGAALSGITHLTVTVAIIMFELTGAVRYIIPTMVAVAVTKMINDRWGQGGIADQMIVFNGLPYLDPKELHHFGTTVAAAMLPVLVVFTADTPYTMAAVRDVLATNYRGFPVVRSAETPEIVGYVTSTDLEHVLRQYKDTECCFGPPRAAALSLASIVNTVPMVVSADTTLEYLADIFMRLGPRHVLVQQDGLLVGIVTRKDILRYEHAVREQQHPPESHEALERWVWGKFQAVGAWLQRR